MNLKALMDQKGLDNEAIAKALHVSPRRVRGWKYGEREPGIRHLIGLADTLGCTVDELIRDRKDGTEA